MQLDESRRISRRALLLAAGGALGAIAAACAAPPTSAPPTTVVAPKPIAAPAAAKGSTAAPTPLPATDPAMAKGLLRAPEANPKRGGTLRMLGAFSVTNFDPYQGATPEGLSKMFNTLVRRNPLDGLRTVIPDLAERWEISPDGKTYTFHMREGVKFHDGTPFTADDVVATFQRVISPPKGLVILSADLLDAADRVEKTGPMTARFVLKAPQPWFLDILSSIRLPILSKKTLDENNQDLRKLMMAPGTGPFMFKEYKPAEKWVFVRNPNYWNKELPYLDSVELLHQADWTARGTAVLTGQADFCRMISYEMYLEGQKRNDVVGVARHAGNHAAFEFTINNRRKPFDDVRVRRAIHLAVNRHNLIKAYAAAEPIDYGGARWMPPEAPFATPVEQILKLPGYREDKAADIAEAKRLLAEAGHPNGFGPIDLVTGNNPNHSQILVPAFQAEIKRALNIESKIRVVEIAARNKEYQEGTFDVLMGVSFRSTIFEFAPGWIQSIQTGGSQNWSRYSNPKFDEIVRQIGSEMDDNKRGALYARGLDLLDENPPFYVVGFADHNVMWRNYVKGHKEDIRLATEEGPVDTIWLDK